MSWRQYFFCLSLLSLFIGCGQISTNREPSAAEIASNNQGVGLMGYFDYQQAHKVFSELVQARPEWLEVKVNLAIATLNLQTETSESEALTLLGQVLAAEPGNLRAHFCSGLLQLYRGETAVAKSHFQTVADADPTDAYAAYYLGQCLARDGNYDQAGAWYQKSMDRDPYLRSAYYGLFQALQRIGRKEEARAMLDQFQKLEGNPQARQAEFKYTRMGPKAEAMVVGQQDTLRPSPPQGALFAAATALPLPEGGRWILATSEVPHSITCSDLNGDGLLDLFVSQAFELENQVLNGVYLAQGDSFQVQPDHPLARIPNVTAALWGDYDNDGLTDVYLCRSDWNQLFKQVSAMDWQDVTQSTGTAGPEGVTAGGLWLDADHDGDLDLFLLQQNGANALLNNNLDGSFRDLAESQGLGGKGNSRAMVAADLDHDRDLDLLIVNQDGPQEVWTNNRLWDYQEAGGFDAFRQQELLACVAADLDSDGQTELYAIDRSGTLSRWQADESGNWKGVLVQSGTLDHLAIADLDGDGRSELLYGTMEGLAVGDLQGRVVWEARGYQPHSWAPVTLNAATGPAIVATAGDGSLHLFAPGPGRFPFMALTFSGKEDKGNSMRSNASGIGTRFAARYGSLWAAGDTFPNHSGPGQSQGPVALGLGGAPRLDFLAIWWSDGVFQTEPALETGIQHAITETQRQLSSCPVLFVWDGNQYQFVSDLLGVGGMGYALGPGQYSKPRPWENFQLPQGLLQPRNGLFQLRITEPMEESCYLDYVGLAAYDLPPGWQMVLDERMNTTDLEPTGQPVFFRELFIPKKAHNERNQDILDQVRNVDQIAAPIPSVDRRFIGILGSEHIITVAFDQPLKGENLILILDGWVEYPYSQTNFAAWQAGISSRPPTLEAQTADGHWTPILKEFGYPAGMPRRMSVPLPVFQRPVMALRLRTNQEIYWDSIAIARAEPCPNAIRHDFPLTRAELEIPGFSRRTTLAQARPYYDMTRNAPLWDTRHQTGFYTELGEMTPLVVSKDDALAIFGPGEGVTFSFQNPVPEPSSGWTRTYFLETAGWCKDMDLYTRDGERVDPLPQTGKDPVVRDQLHNRFNTRFRSGY